MLLHCDIHLQDHNLHTLRGVAVNAYNSKMDLWIESFFKTGESNNFFMDVENSVTLARSDFTE